MAAAQANPSRAYSKMDACVPLKGNTDQVMVSKGVLLRGAKATGQSPLNGTMVLKERCLHPDTRTHSDRYVWTWRRSFSQGLWVWHPHLGLQNKDLMWPREMVHIFHSSTQEAEELSLKPVWST